MRHASTRGFSLLEMSVVLVIIALIIGGVVAGQSILQAATTRSVIASARNYLDAVGLFRDKYQYLPGDMPNAMAIWNGAAACPSAASTSKLTCNGDGNGIITDLTDATTKREMFLIWKHLANAGLIDSQYSGIGGSTVIDAVPLVNVPAGKIEGSGYTILSIGNLLGTTYLSPAPLASDMGSARHAVIFGAGRVANGLSAGPTDAPILPTAQAWAIDSKIDDGSPLTGLVRPYNATLLPHCVNATDYLLTDTTQKACSLVFGAAF